MTPRTADKPRKREKILRAALRIFSRQGLHNFKMIDIAAKAGVGKGTLYEYFPSKEALTQGAVELMFADYEIFFARRLDGIDDPVAQIRAIIVATGEFFSRPRGRLNLMFDLWVASLPRVSTKPGSPGIKEMYARLRGEFGTIISAGIQRGDFKPVDPEFAASVMIATLDGLLFQSALGLIRLDDPEVTDKLCQAILNGVT